MHAENCNFVKSNCEYVGTHNYCPHEEHACDCIASKSDRDSIVVGHDSADSKLNITQQVESIGEISDGFHTFNDLYAHRTALLRALVVTNVQMCWKSRNHEEGGTPMHEGYFIVGINLARKKKTHGGGILKTPITYHIENKYWDDFECHEYEYAPKWDGHTPEDVVDRLMKW